MTGSFEVPIPRGYISAPVPFREQNGRRYLTEQDLVEHQHLGEFVKAFPADFQADPVRAIYWFGREGPPWPP